MKRFWTALKTMMTSSQSPINNECRVLTWENIEQSIKEIISYINIKNITIFEKIIAISRGGLIPATMLSHELALPLYVFGARSYNNKQQGNFEIYQPLPPNIKWENSLIVDDIVDTGDTFNNILNYSKVDLNTVLFVAICSKYGELPNKNLNSCLLYTIQPEDDRWIKFPWEVLTIEKINSRVK